MRAFIVRPFGTKTDREAQPIDFDRVERELIDPALDSFGVTGRTTGEILEAGSIHADMFQRLLTADLIIADVSIDNANVYYELGIRHALREKRTVLLRTQADRYPFDLEGYRYLVYDRADPGASLTQLIDVIHATINSTRQDSPVFRYLPELREPERARFLTVPSDFRDEIALALARGLPGDLDLLATEVRGFDWEVEGLRLIGRAQYALKANRSARRTWEAVCRFDEIDKEANTLLGTIYQRLGDLPLSDLVLDRVLERTETSRAERAEAYALLGRNAKSRWLADWRSEPAERRTTRALRSPLLEEAFRQYQRAFEEDLNHFYSGLNAAALLTILTELATALPEVWEERADTPEEAESLLRARRAELDRLAATVDLSLEAAKGRLARTGDEDMWVGISEADLYFLRSRRPQRVARKYEQALIGASAFDEDAVRRQLEIFPALAVLQENAEAALAVLKSEPPVTTQPLVILFTGHRIDAPGREPPRFHPTNEPEARRAILDALRRELERAPHGAVGLAGGASGGDILFHEACAELGIPTTLYLAVGREEYVTTSVRDAEGDWLLRFNALYGALPHRELGSSAKLPRWLSSRHKRYSIWQRNNLWLLRNAIAADRDGGPNVTVIALWDGQEGDGAGGTKDMVDQARELGAHVVILDTSTLFRAQPKRNQAEVPPPAAG